MMTKGKLVLGFILLIMVIYNVIYCVNYGNPWTNTYNGVGTFISLFTTWISGIAVISFILIHVLWYVIDHWDDKL